MHALDKCNTKSHKDIRALDYHGENNRKNWQAYVIGHKKYQDFQTAPVEQEFNDFTDRKKVTLLINGIKWNILDFVISVVSGGAAHADFESAQLMLTEHIYMLTEHTKFSKRNVSTTYAAHGNWPRRGDYIRNA